MNPVQYAEHVGASERSVWRWLKAGELPAASKAPDGQWFIPANAVRQRLSTDMAVTSQSVSVPDLPVSGHSARGDSLAEALGKLPAFLTLAQAARLLGVSPLRIAENPDRFEAERVGRLGSGGRSLMVPARVVRQIAGI